MLITDVDEWERLTEECEVVEGRTTIDTRRWVSLKTMVVKDESKFFRLNWSEVLTEEQCPDFDEINRESVQVFPKQVAKTIYVTQEE